MIVKADFLMKRNELQFRVVTYWSHSFRLVYPMLPVSLDCPHFWLPLQCSLTFTYFCVFSSFCMFSSSILYGYYPCSFWHLTTGTCFIQKIYAPSSSLLQGKHLTFSSSPLRLNIFRLFVILSLTQLYRYTPEIFLFSTATFKYIYRAPLRQIGQE